MSTLTGRFTRLPTAAVPAAHLDRVVEPAEYIEHTERRIVEAVRAGSTLAQACADLGYHALQSRSQ